MNIPFQKNEFGIVAMLPDGRVEVLDHSSQPWLYQLREEKITYQPETADNYILEDFDVDLHQFHLSAPLIAFLEVTNFCNLTCHHCYAESSPTGKRNDELTLSEIFKLLDTWEEMGVLQVFLSGGEIFAHPNAVEIINYASQKNFLTQVFTNGLLIEEQHLKELHPGTSFFVSFDSAGRTSIRGKMTYEKLEWLHHAVDKHGHIMRTAVNVHKANIDEVFAIFHWCREKGFNRPQWIDTLRVGRAMRNPQMFFKTEDAPASFQTYQKCMDLYTNDTKEYQKIQSIDTIKFCTRLEAALNIEKAGRMMVYVNSSGNVYPSSNYAGHHRECEGNIRENTFQILWKENFKISRETLQSSFKDCATCPIFKNGIWCQFRCRSLSENLHGNPLRCGADEYMKSFMMLSHQYAKEQAEKGLILELQ